MAWVSKTADEWNVVENGKVLKGPIGTKEEAIKAMDLCELVDQVL